MIGVHGEATRFVKASTLLHVGAASAVVFLVVLLVEGALRPGYDPLYHTGSALSLGDRGWIQIANLVQVGLGMLAFAVGVRRVLETPVGAVLLAIFGLSMIGSGVFVMDPMRGYPPGAPSGTPTELSWHQQIHNALGPLGFFALLAAALTLARRLQGRWRLYTMITAVLGLVLTIGTAASWANDTATTGLVQRGLLFVYLLWIAALGVHLGKTSGPRPGPSRGE